MSLLLLFTPTWWDYRDGFKKRIIDVYKKKYKKSVTPKAQPNRPEKSAVNVKGNQEALAEESKKRGDYLRFLEAEIGGLSKQISGLNTLRDIINQEKLATKLKRLEVARQALDEELMVARDQKDKEDFLAMMLLTLA